MSEHNDGDELQDLAGLIQSAEFEARLHPTETNAQRATRILEEASTVAAMSIVDLSRRASNEQLRFKASQYILDRVLGDGKGSLGSGVKGPIEEAFEGIVIPDDVSGLTSQ